MQFKALLAAAVQHPLAKAAAVKVAADITEHGLVSTIEFVLDRTAYMIAKQIINSERTMEKQ